MLTKKQVLTVIRDMPYKFETEQLFDKLVLLNKIEEGGRQIKDGKTYSTSEVREKLKKWLK